MSFEVAPLSRKAIKNLKKNGSEACRDILGKLQTGVEVAMTSDGVEEVMDDFLQAAFPNRLEEIDALPYGEAVSLFSQVLHATFVSAAEQEKN